MRVKSAFHERHPALKAGSIAGAAAGDSTTVVAAASRDDENSAFNQEEKNIRSELTLFYLEVKNTLLAIPDLLGMVALHRSAAQGPCHKPAGPAGFLNNCRTR